MFYNPATLIPRGYPAEVHPVHHVNDEIPSRDLWVGAAGPDMDPEILSLIEQDLRRTRRAELGVENVLQVGRMLVQYAGHDAELGHQQGMSFVAAAFAVSAHQSLEDAYERFRQFMPVIRHLWLPRVSVPQESRDIFVRLARDRRWFRHLEDHGVEPDVYLMKAWHKFFGSWLLMQTFQACLPLLETEGFDGVMALTLAVLDRAGREICRRTPDVHGPAARFADGSHRGLCEFLTRPDGSLSSLRVMSGRINTRKLVNGSHRWLRTIRGVPQPGLLEWLPCTPQQAA